MRGAEYPAALVIIVVSVAIMSVFADAMQRPTTGISHRQVAAAPSGTRATPQYNYDVLRQKITYGRASLADARRAMTDPDPVSLSNSLHALYSMRLHRGVVRLLDGMWQVDRQKYPELAWQHLVRPPARIALASTINRVRIIRTDAYLAYIREHKGDEHEFNRAQVAVALGFNGHIDDLAYLKAMSDGDNHYVAQSAITGLSLFGGKQARNVLIELDAKYRGTSRGDLMTEMLRQAYDWPPPKPRPTNLAQKKQADDD